MFDKMSFYVMINYGLYVYGFLLTLILSLILLLSGKRFYAHRICLLASSDAFRAMFDGGYRVRIDLFKNFLLAFSYK
jgi:hypothetical protein